MTLKDSKRDTELVKVLSTQEAQWTSTPLKTTLYLKTANRASPMRENSAGAEHAATTRGELWLRKAGNK